MRQADPLACGRFRAQTLGARQVVRPASPGLLLPDVDAEQFPVVAAVAGPGAQLQSGSRETAAAVRKGSVPVLAAFRQAQAVAWLPEVRDGPA